MSCESTKDGSTNIIGQTPTALHTLGEAHTSRMPRLDCRSAPAPPGSHALDDAAEAVPNNACACNRPTRAVSLSFGNKLAAEEEDRSKDLYRRQTPTLQGLLEMPPTGIEPVHAV